MFCRVCDQLHLAALHTLWMELTVFSSLFDLGGRSLKTLIGTLLVRYLVRVAYAARSLLYLPRYKRWNLPHHARPAHAKLAKCCQNMAVTVWQDKTQSVAFHPNITFTNPSLSLCSVLAHIYSLIYITAAWHNVPMIVLTFLPSLWSLSPVWTT